MSLLRRLFVKTKHAEPIDLAGNTSIVTGASPGSLGFATAKTLASWGASVVITTRSNTDALAEAIRAQLDDDAAERITAYPLELSNRGSVERFAASFLDDHPRLDVLVNNAGVHLDLLSRWKTPHLVDGFEMHWRINYLGTAHLTHLLLPVLQKTGRETGDARIVNVGSHLHARGSNDDLFRPTRPYSSWNAYGNSKLALMHMTSEIQRRYASQANLQAYSLHPGSVFTKVADKGLEGAKLIGSLRSMMSPVEAFFLKTPEEGAQTQIHCATRPRLPGGLYYVECAPTEPSEDSKDARVATRLWEETWAWIEGQSSRP
ncbi:MAG: SDR family NAD(P)-dependent oxidoreductase [Myxococcales bacterium]|jgi:NAD(P)-dependent dehydrogenase (short-subunit alcohol dehydrogenase family)